MFIANYPVTLSSWRNPVLRLCCLVLVASLSMVATAAGQEPLKASSLTDRPAVNGEPIVVETGIFILDIDEIDDVKQRFQVDLFIVARWLDGRLALPEEHRQGHRRFMSPDDVWTPRMLILNDRGLEPHLRNELEVDDLGNVTIKNRYSGELSVDLEFRDFPFDRQQLPIDIVSYEYTTEELKFVPRTALVSTGQMFSIEGWRLEVLAPMVGVFVVPEVNTELPRLTFLLEARRDSDYYALTMLVPMALIIFMAWTVFWLQPSIVGPRIAISTASIFSLIALGVSVRLGLPKVSYLTKADMFVLGCTFMVFLALGIAVLGSRWASSDRMEQALKANAISRWVYMLLFFLIAFAALYH